MSASGVAAARPAAVLERLSFLGGEACWFEPLDGGLTNRNYHVRTRSGREFVARFAGAKSELLAIDRDAEAYNSAIAATLGLGPRVVEYSPAEHVLVVDWIDAQTCTDDELDDPDVLTRVAAACRTLHSGPRFMGDFDMFDVQANYLQIVQQNGFRLPPDYLDFVDIVEELNTVLHASSPGTVACHNDLLAANIMVGARQLWLIDYEYSGNNDAVLRTRQHLERGRAAPRPPRASRVELLRASRAGRGRPRAAVRDDGEIRLDAVGRDPGRRQRGRLRLLGVGHGQVRPGGRGVPQPGATTTHRHNQRIRGKGRPIVATVELNDDEKRLAELGYKQELNRSWSGFSNFAISFSIISILAGCFTTFFAGWNNGGPAAIAWGWPIVSAFILVIGLCMSELVSAFPTSGGIYWWASKLGGVKAGYYTGWLNLIGLLAIDASVAYGCATFFDLTLDTYSKSWAAGYSLTRVFLIFLVVLVLVALVNIFSSHLLAILNNISVWWHVVRRDDRRAHPRVRAQPPREPVVGLHPHGEQHRLLRRAHQRLRASSSLCCRSR